MSTQYAFGKIVTSGLTLSLDAGDINSYPGSGLVWNSLVDTNTGSLESGAVYNASFKGNIYFDGTNDYVKLPAVIDTNTSFTVCTFFSIRSQRTNTILAGWDNSTYFQIRTTSVNAIEILRAKAVSMGTFSNSTITLNTPWHLTITRSSNTYSLYLNGIFASSITSTQTFATTGPALGINQNGEYLTGAIYNFNFYNRVLSTIEIQQNYNAQKRRFLLI